MKKISLFFSIILIAILGLTLLSSIREPTHSDSENDGGAVVNTHNIPPELEAFISAYEKQVLPIGTLVKVEGRFELVSMPKGANPESKPMVHHSGDYECIFPVGVPNKIYYRSKNFSVPRDVGGGVREMSYYDAEIFSNGREVLELEYGVRDTAGTYRTSNNARLSANPSWYTVDFATGRAFFPFNVGFNRETLTEIAYENVHDFEIQKSQSDILITASMAHRNMHLQMDPSFALLKSAYISQYSNNRNGNRIVYSDIQSLAFEDRRIHIPRKAEFYTLSGDETLYSSVNEVYAIKILHDRDPSKIFEGTIPHGWTVSNDIEDTEYQQGEIKIFRYMKKVLNEF